MSTLGSGMCCYRVFDWANVVEFASDFERVAEMRLRTAQALALAGAHIVDSLLDTDDRNTDVDIVVLKYTNATTTVPTAPLL